MKIITYNVNGLRAAVGKGLPEWLAQEQPDVLCLQETKLQPDQYPAEAFEALGYKCMGEYGIAGRRFFRKGGDERTHHIHIFEESSRGDIERHLAVRDYLRTHGEAAEAYASLKTRLAELYPYSIDDYCDGKDEFVKSLERKALEWYKTAHVQRTSQ